jgi:hypothetical protein
LPWGTGLSTLHGITRSGHCSAREARRLHQQDVRVTMGPTTPGPAQVAIFADACGYLIWIDQPIG